MGDQDHELCNIRLGLGLGFGDEFIPKKIQKINNINNNNKTPKLFPDLSFTLINPKQELGLKMMEIHEAHHSNPSNENSQNSSFNNPNNAICGSETERKKLRLSKEQSTLLEESFKLHTTLNPAQKQALAQQLNLKTRQVEVWFQNRRARTKLKQTEVDCEFLKKCCERLNEENRKMKKELNELRSIKHGASQLYIQLPKAATLTICPSCDKITTAAAANAAANAAAVYPNSPPH